MTVSVIIPTYNGAHKILNVLRSVERQTTPPDEVIVVIDGSTDNTRQILEENSFSFKSFRIIEQSNGGRAKVRNKGAQEASGTLLIFFDDDMRPAPECIRLHTEHHLKYPGSILTGAQMEEVVKTAPDFLRFKGMLSRKWYQPYLPQKKIDTKDQLFLTAANLSMPKALFDSLGGFDERLTDAEDFDLGVRAFLANIPLYVNPQAHAWHDDPVTCAAYIRRQAQYAEAHRRLRLLKPELYKDENKYLPAPPKGVKAILFSVFSYRCWIVGIDRNYWPRILPRAIRYKLYDIVLTAHQVKHLQ